MADNAPFAARIRELRTRQGLSQAAAARAIGRNPKTWQGWEAAEHHPRGENIADIARALALPIASLYTPQGWTAIAEVIVTDAVLERLRTDGDPYAQQLAGHYAQALLPALHAAAQRHGSVATVPGAGGRKPRLLTPRNHAALQAREAREAAR